MVSLVHCTCYHAKLPLATSERPGQSDIQKGGGKYIVTLSSLLHICSKCLGISECTFLSFLSALNMAASGTKRARGEGDESVADANDSVVEKPAMVLVVCDMQEK